ncbi:MAG: hypothetical protein ACI8RZ_002298 [Myxococcota bacterium]|jgi:hypothetical protein
MILHLMLACSGGEQQFSNNNPDGVAEQGVAELSYAPLEFAFTDLNWNDGVSQSAELVITNLGDGNLSLTVVDISDSGGGAFYSTEETNLVLQPEADRAFTVVATLTEFTEAVGELRVKSNDADFLDLRIPLYATPEGWTGGGDDTGDTGK